MRERVPRNVLSEPRSVPLFSDYTNRQIQAVASLGAPVTIAAGRDLTVAGARGAEWLVVLSGRASCRVRGRAIASFGAGDCFGEMPQGLVHVRVRSHSHRLATTARSTRSPSCVRSVSSSVCQSVATAPTRKFYTDFLKDWFSRRGFHYRRGLSSCSSRSSVGVSGHRHDVSRPIARFARSSVCAATARALSAPLLRMASISPGSLDSSA